MVQVGIDNAILNSPYHERARHRLFDDDGITNDVAGGLRPNSYFVPIAAPKKKGKAARVRTRLDQRAAARKRRRQPPAHRFDRAPRPFRRDSPNRHNQCVHAGHLVPEA